MFDGRKIFFDGSQGKILLAAGLFIRLFVTNLAGFFSRQPGRILGQNPGLFSKSCPENKSCRSGVQNPGRKKFLPG